jgi:hypothetical protein
MSKRACARCTIPRTATARFQGRIEILESMEAEKKSGARYGASECCRQKAKTIA